MICPLKVTLLKRHADTTQELAQSCQALSTAHSDVTSSKFANILHQSQLRLDTLTNQLQRCSYTGTWAQLEGSLRQSTCRSSSWFLWKWTMNSTAHVHVTLLKKESVHAGVIQWFLLHSIRMVARVLSYYPQSYMLSFVRVIFQTSPLTSQTWRSRHGRGRWRCSWLCAVYSTSVVITSHSSAKPTPSPWI